VTSSHDTGHEDVEAMIERGAKMAEVLDTIGGTFVRDDAHVKLDCDRINALAAAAGHKLGRDKAGAMSDFIRAGLAQLNGVAIATDIDGYDRLGRMGYATCSLAIELGVQAVSAGLGAGMLTTNGKASERAALAMKIVDRLYRTHMDGLGEMLTADIMSDLIRWGKTNA
jgi:hypothetical protein